MAPSSPVPAALLAVCALLAASLHGAGAQQLSSSYYDGSCPERLRHGLRRIAAARRRPDDKQREERPSPTSTRRAASRCWTTSRTPWRAPARASSPARTSSCSPPRSPSTWREGPAGGWRWGGGTPPQPASTAPTTSPPRRRTWTSSGRSSPPSGSTTPTSSPSRGRTPSAGAQCRFIQDRLDNFSGTRQPDPTLDGAYLNALRRSCPASAGTGNTRLSNLDPASPDAFDSSYYANIVRNRGLLRSDQVMLSAPGGAAATTAPIVRRFAGSQEDFFRSFARAMIKMGNIAPLTGNMGEVRRNCRVMNRS
ncbi:hypothetical protein ACQ4PT_030813 [Festuca glaucescens]